MPTLNGTLVDATGTALGSTPISFVRISDPVAVGATTYSRDITTATTALNGTFSKVLTAGYWRMRWYQSQLASEVILAMPDAGGPYTMEDLLVDAAAIPGGPPEEPTQNFFRTMDDLRISDTLEDMVAVLTAGAGEPVWYYRDTTSTAADDEGRTTIVRTDNVRFTRFPA